MWPLYVQMYNTSLYLNKVHFVLSFTNVNGQVDFLDGMQNSFLAFLLKLDSLRLIPQKS